MNTGGGATPLPKALPLSGPLNTPLGMPFEKSLETPMGSTGFKGGQSEGFLSLPLKVHLSELLPFMQSALLEEQHSPPVEGRRNGTYIRLRGGSFTGKPGTLVVRGMNGGVLGDG